MAQLSTSASAFKITVGGRSCAPVTLSTTSVGTLVTCPIPDLVAGPQELLVRVDDVSGMGYASISPDLVPVSYVTGQPTVFTQHGNITGLSVKGSGVRGGAVVVISGTGFDPKVENNVVVVAGSSCSVVASSANQISCVLGPGSDTSPVVNASTGVALPVFSGGRGVTVEVRVEFVVVLGIQR